MPSMDFLFCFPDVLSLTFFACHTVYHIGGFAVDVLFDGECVRRLCDVDLVCEGSQFTGVTSLIATLVEPWIGGTLVSFVVSSCHVYLFPPSGVKHPPAFLTGVTVFVKGDGRCSNDVVVRW